MTFVTTYIYSDPLNKQQIFENLYEHSRAATIKEKQIVSTSLQEY